MHGEDFSVSAISISAPSVTPSPSISGQREKAIFRFYHLCVRYILMREWTTRNDRSCEVNVSFRSYIQKFISLTSLVRSFIVTERSAFPLERLTLQLLAVMLRCGCAAY
jgi:hypothetical protein